MAEPQKRAVPEMQQALTEAAHDIPTESGADNRRRPGGESWTGDHAVNLRLSIPFLFGRYYLTVVAGRERRSSERRAVERTKHPVARLGNLAVLVGFGVLVGLAGLAVIQMLSAYVLVQSEVLVPPR